MQVHEYDDFVDICPVIDDPVLGLAGEVGEVIEIIKKDRRKGAKRTEADLNELEYELGDILWYLTKIAHTYGINLEEIVNSNYDKLMGRHHEEIVPSGEPAQS